MPVTKQINLDRQGTPEFIQEVDSLWRDVRRQLALYVEKQASVTFRRDGTGLLFNVLIPEPPKESSKPPAEAETPDPAGAEQTPGALKTEEPAKAAEPPSIQPKPVRRKQKPKPPKLDDDNVNPAQ